MPASPPIPYDDQDPHSQRLMRACRPCRLRHRAPSTSARARRGYFASISYIDEKIGELLEVLAAMRLGRGHDRRLHLRPRRHARRARPLVQDELLRGLGAGAADDRRARAARPGASTPPVSTLDVVPTLAELGGVDLGEVAPWTDGESLVPLARGERPAGPVPMEYAAEGSRAPIVALRDGRWKLVLCEADPPLLFDLAADPHELANLAADPAHAAALATG